MADWFIALLIGIALGLLLGIKIARSSKKAEPILGGLPAEIFHSLACSSLSSGLPFIIAGLIVGLHFLALFGTGIGLIGVTALLLLIYAVVERGARAAKQTTPA